MKKGLKTFFTLLLALVVATSAFANGSPEKSEATIPTIKWVTVGNGMPDNYEAWQAEVNKYLEEKIGVHLDIEVVGWGEWDNRRNVIVTTNEPWDIIFGNDGTFFKDVSLGALAPIDELLKETPGITEVIPADLWNATTVQGHIYGVPTYKDSSMTYFWVWDKAIVDKYDIPYEDLHHLADIRPYAEKVHKGEHKPVWILAADAPEYMGYDSFGTGLSPIGVKYDDDTRTVVRTMQQEDFMTYLKEMRTWYEKGLINSDAGTLPQVPTYTILGAAQGWPSAGRTVWGPNRGCEVVVSQWNDTLLSTSSVLGSVNAINASSPNQLEALKVLELANTDTKFRDMLKFGLEGDNFEYLENGRVRQNPDRSWGMAAYTQAQFFNASLSENDDPDFFTGVKELNNHAFPSVMLGFAFDTEAVENELINCRNIYAKYKQILVTGAVDPESTVEKLYKELDKAGLQKVIDEAQRQIDAAF